VAVKGREQPLPVFQPLGFPGELQPGQEAGAAAFATGLDHYRRRRFLPAAASFQQALQHWPDHKPSQVFLQRCLAYQDQPPPPDWDAVFRPEKK
jgi:hypothetical protein